mmetsp:Transcript_17381/g.32104  ORF Transcript_17381/g.32104 Transcript_17381/m.32104 type:complete len:109 (+) Transcript_17381:421-747(+)
MSPLPSRESDTCDYKTVVANMAGDWGVMFCILAHLLGSIGGGQLQRNVTLLVRFSEYSNLFVPWRKQNNYLTYLFFSISPACCYFSVMCGEEVGKVNAFEDCCVTHAS